MRFHVIAGLPRSGSTLLCNILNQNPLFHAGSTSALAPTLAGMTQLWSGSAEVKGDLDVAPEATEQRNRNCQLAVLKEWYAPQFKAKKVVFDKSRAWNFPLQSLTLRELAPKAKLIVCVRDLRNVFASCEKRAISHPFLSHEFGLAASQGGRYREMFAPDGMIGGPLRGMLALRDRDASHVVYVAYEWLSSNPREALDRLYSELSIKPFKHDFDNIENTATDLDVLYLNKFPHEGSGKVTKGNPKEFEDWVSPDIQTAIMNEFPEFNRRFGYAA